MASALFSDLASRLSLSGVDIDNWTYKCYSRVSVGIFWVAAACSVASSYTGSAIECKGGVDSYDKNYCWLHGTKHLTADEISKDINNGQSCIALDDNPDDKVTNYYIWVSLVLFLSGAVFALPNELWKHIEGGMMEQFGEDRKKFLEKPEKGAEIFRKITNNETKRYFFTFVMFEMLNYIVGILVFALTDNFLSGKFSSYGLDTISYLNGNGKIVEVTGKDGTVSGTVNPMCNLFPTIVNCEFSYYGVNSGADTRSAICLMGQNIMNQKIYLVLWIWFVILFGVSAIMFTYRIVTLALPAFRRTSLLRHMKTTNSKVVDDLYLDFEHIGNWFLLSQIGQNTNPYTFREFLKESKKLEDSNKRYPKNTKFKSESKSKSDLGNDNGDNQQFELEQRNNVETAVLMN